MAWKGSWGPGLFLGMWADLLVCHCDQSRGFWESQQVKGVSNGEMARESPPVTEKSSD